MNQGKISREIRIGLCENGFIVQEIKDCRIFVYETVDSLLNGLKDKINKNEILNFPINEGVLPEEQKRVRVK